VKNCRPFSIFHFQMKMENEKRTSIFHFLFSIHAQKSQKRNFILNYSFCTGSYSGWRMKSEKLNRSCNHFPLPLYLAVTSIILAISVPTVRWESAVSDQHHSDVTANFVTIGFLRDIADKRFRQLLRQVASCLSDYSSVMLRYRVITYCRLEFLENNFTVN